MLIVGALCTGYDLFIVCVYLVNCVCICNFAGWATGLFAGEGEWTLEFSFFKVVIDLTDAGHG